MAAAWPPSSAAAPASSQVQQLIEETRAAPARAPETVTVIIEGRLGAAHREVIAARGGTVRYSVDRRHEVRLPSRALDALVRSLPDDVYVRLPYPHQGLDTVGDGVTVTGASAMQTLGHDGAGVTVGVIDLGFGGYKNSQSSGDLPENLTIQDYTGGGTGGTAHGTNVAEIVHDMAPGADLFLAKVSTDVQLDQATQDMIDAGVEVVNHSVAWFGAAFYDGTGPICATADDAESGGVQWVNAAGNHRRTHFLGTFTDADGDLRHEFASNQDYNTISLNQGRTIQLILNWDDYPTSDIDYNLYLYDGDPENGGSVVASSTNGQNGNRFSTPRETLTYTPSTTADYFIVVTKADSSTAHIPLTLFGIGPSFGVQTHARSLIQPADCLYTIAVGATRVSDDRPEGFSSEGPTVDGRAKPQIAGPDRVETSRTSSFAGTSASSPHAAGAAAALLSRDSTLSPGQIRQSLGDTAHDVHTSGFDDRTGDGRLSLDADEDGLNHDDEAAAGTDPTSADTDSDGLDDGAEIEQYGTDPTDSDTDNDGLSDGEEVNSYGTAPLNADTDGDGLTDGEEVLEYDTDPLEFNLIGDVAPRGSPDGVIDVADHAVLLRLVHGLATPSTQEQGLADMNGDGVLDVLDVLEHAHALGYR